MAKPYNKVVQVEIRVPSWFTFGSKIQQSTLIANTYNFTRYNLYLLYQLFYRVIFYHICCISCYVVASFILFVVLALQSQYPLSYLLYQLFYYDIFYHICCNCCSAMTSFIIFAVLVGLAWHPLSYLMYWLFCRVNYFAISLPSIVAGPPDHTLYLMCFIVCTPRVLGLCTNQPVAWSY